MKPSTCPLIQRNKGQTQLRVQACQPLHKLRARTPLLALTDGAGDRSLCQGLSQAAAPFKLIPSPTTRLAELHIICRTRSPHRDWQNSNTAAQDRRNRMRHLAACRGYAQTDRLGVLRGYRRDRNVIPHRPLGHHSRRLTAPSPPLPLFPLLPSHLHSIPPGSLDRYQWPTREHCVRSRHTVWPRLISRLPSCVRSMW